MSEQMWTAVDDYLEAQFMPADPALEHVLQTTLDAGLPAHLAVSSLQGKFLQMLAQIHGAKKILEIGTLAGYSTIWLARALPQDGRLISLEAVPTNVTLARKNIEFAGLSHLVDVHAGKALDIFPEIEQSGIAPFDFIFIDADKSGYKDYVDWALKLSRPGTVIILDNVIRGGGIVNFDNNTRTMTGLREYFAHLAGQKKLTSTTLQTVGCKGHDGFTLAVVL
ncbi:MAG: O-methyltransferase [Moraxellaceae bacterium]|nr:MAG: O-methyltransferase [Moraxellaceae bacterium]